MGLLLLDRRTDQIVDRAKNDLKAPYSVATREESDKIWADTQDGILPITIRHVASPRRRNHSKHFDTTFILAFSNPSAISGTHIIVLAIGSNHSLQALYESRSGQRSVGRFDRNTNGPLAAFPAAGRSMNFIEIVPLGPPIKKWTHDCAEHEF